MARKESQAMRLMGAGVIAYLLAAAFAVSGSAQSSVQRTGSQASQPGGKPRLDGQQIFRFDTFGDEQLWTDVLRMHEVVATLPPTTALGVGLKIDVDALPMEVVSALRAGLVDLTKPEVTVELIRLNAVVGV